MADLSTQTIIRDGLEFTRSAAASGGDKFVNTGKEFVLIKNANVSLARTVTFDITVDVDGQSVTDRQVSIPASSEKAIGPFTAIYNDSDNKVSMTYSDSGADLTLAVLRV